jgi:hypothetical protein
MPRRVLDHTTFQHRPLLCLYAEHEDARRVSASPSDWVFLVIIALDSATRFSRQPGEREGENFRKVALVQAPVTVACVVYYANPLYTWHELHSSWIQDSSSPYSPRSSNCCYAQISKQIWYYGCITTRLAQQTLHATQSSLYSRDPS